MRRLLSPFAQSPPTPLAANRLVRAPRLSRVARTIHGHEDGFAPEVRWSIRVVWLLVLCGVGTVCVGFIVVSLLCR
jgi:hypothetical protein